jgi:hypothetical protein
MIALPHRLFQFLLVICKQGMNLLVRLVADGVNLWTKFLPGRRWILIEKHLNPVGPVLPGLGAPTRAGRRLPRQLFG